MNKYRKLSTNTHVLPIQTSQRSSKSWVIIIAMVTITTISALVVLLTHGNDSFLVKTTDSASTVSVITTASSQDNQVKGQLISIEVLEKNQHQQFRTQEMQIPTPPKSSSSSSVSESFTATKTHDSMISSVRPATPSPIQLVSLHKPATADVRGNLGPASVITNEDVSDWLKDRWQAAKNMQGEPIPGRHWLEIDLQDIHTVEKIVIDWERAFSDQWTVIGRSAANMEWRTLGLAKNAKTTENNDKHIIHELVLSDYQPKIMEVRFVRLLIHRSSTRWGPSVWRFQVWGRPLLSQQISSEAVTIINSA